MEDYARKYDRHDLDRLGLFIEMPFLDARLRKVKAKKFPVLHRPFIVGGPKTKSGNSDGYFDEFKRLETKDRRRQKKGEFKGPIKAAFIPAGPSKIHSTPDDYYGCFFPDGLAAFSPILRGAKKYPRNKVVLTLPKPNPMTSPGKKGGPGYVDITISPYPEHKSDRKIEKGSKRKNLPAYKPFYPQSYPNYFDENPFLEDPVPRKRLYLQDTKSKKLKIDKGPFIPTGPGKLSGGCHDGDFSKWPEHMKDPFMPKLKKSKKDEYTKAAFRPPNVDVKTLQFRSALYNVTFTMNPDNWRTFGPTYVKDL